MAVSASVAARACARAFDRVCELGQDIAPDTPAACFLSAAARHVDAASILLQAGAPELGSDRIAKAMARLMKAGDILRDIAELGDGQEVQGLDRLSVLVDGLCVTITLDQPDQPDQLDDAPERRDRLA